MDVVRSSLLVVVCILAIAGTITFFGHKQAPLTPEEKVIAGRWSGDAMNLEFGDDGRYALVIGTSGSAAVECGKWRVESGSLQMRAKTSAGTGGMLLMRQPGFRAGKFRRDGEALDLDLQAALPGDRSKPERWALRATTGPLLDRCR